MAQSFPLLLAAAVFLGGIRPSSLFCAPRSLERPREVRALAPRRVVDERLGFRELEEALFVGGSREEQEQAGALDWLSHFLWLPWTLTFSLFTPPPAYLGGWVCFAVSLGHIAWLTIIIGDLAELFGCVADVDDNITAISFVALGTSVPDLFASMTAAKQDPHADASIVNVTGSNSVNVFLGIGLPWLLASFYWYMQGTTFAVKSQGLSFSVLVFTCGACVTLSVIQIRRWKVGGELGGPVDTKAYSSFLLVVLWLSYIGLSVWKYQNIDAPLTQDLMMLGLTIPLVGVVMMIFAAIRFLLKLSKDLTPPKTGAAAGSKLTNTRPKVQPADKSFVSASEWKKQQKTMNSALDKALGGLRDLPLPDNFKKLQNVKSQ